jgi:hypothetical protein
VNSQLPEGYPRLPSAEAVARGFGDTVFVENGVQLLRLTTDVKLVSCIRLAPAKRRGGVACSTSAQRSSGPVPITVTFRQRPQPDQSCSTD